MLFESAVTICIILNTVFLAVEHHGMSAELKHVLEIGNKVFTTFFTTEAVLKLLALSKEYFASGWNIFDLVIVIASLVDLFAESINGISVLRGMRLVSSKAYCGTRAMQKVCDAKGVRCRRRAMQNTCDAEGVRCRRDAMQKVCDAERVQCRTRAMTSLCDAERV